MWPSALQKLVKQLKKKAFSWLAGDSTTEQVHLSGTRFFPYLSDLEVNNNTIVLACVLWVARSFQEPKLVVKSTDSEGKEIEIPEHDVIKLLRNPQGGVSQTSKFSARRMVAASVYSRLIDGNAYWHKLRNGRGKVIGLDYVPHTHIEPIPVTGTTNILSHYRVYTSTGNQIVQPEDIIHFADGIDPHNMLKGLSPLKAAMRMVMTDNEAAVYSHAILKMPVPSYLVSAKDKEVELTQESANELAAHILAQVSGENRGRVMVPTIPLKAEKLGLSPEELALEKMHRIPEERISAIFGVPAIVAGLGAGLERSTFANFKEAREAATEQLLCPLWEVFADDLNNQLLPEFSADQSEHICFNLKTVRVLQEDETARWDRAGKAFATGLITRAEGKSHIGLAFDDARDNLYITDIQGGLTEEEKKAFRLGVLKQTLVQKMRADREIFEDQESEDDDS